MKYFKLSVFLLTAIAGVSCVKRNYNSSISNAISAPASNSENEMISGTIVKASMDYIVVKASTRLAGNRVTYCNRTWGDILTPKSSDKIDCVTSKADYISKWPTTEGSRVLCHFGSSDGKFTCDATNPLSFNLQGKGSGTVKANFIQYQTEPIRARVDLVVDLTGTTEKKVQLFCALSLEQIKKFERNSKFECSLNRQEFLKNSPSGAGIVYGCFRGYQEDDFPNRMFPDSYGCVPYELIEK
jgi:hypothetical protein